MGYVFFFLILLFSALLIPFSTAASQGATEGLKLFGTCVFPSLFPFMVCADLMINSDKISAFRPKSNRLAFLLFSVLCGICGTPSSALVCDTEYRRGNLSQERASVLCAAINLPCPVFVVSALSSGLLRDVRYSIPFAVSVYAPALLFAFIIGFGRSAEASPRITTTAPSLFGRLPISISNAVMTSLRVGGTIVFFKVAYSVVAAIGILNRALTVIKGPVVGLVEMTNGLAILSADKTRFSLSLCAFLLSFGGLCIFVQTKMLFPKLKTGLYLITKLISGIVSALLFWAILPLFPASVPSFSSIGLNELASRNTLSGAFTIVCCVLPSLFAMAVIALLSSLSKRKKEPHNMRLG